MKSRIKGFTLIELLVVISIIGVLTAIVYPIMSAGREKAFNAKAYAELDTIKKSLQADAIDNFGYPYPNAGEGYYCIGAPSTDCTVPGGVGIVGSLSAETTGINIPDFEYVREVSTSDGIFKGYVYKTCASSEVQPNGKCPRNTGRVIIPLAKEIKEFSAGSFDQVAAGDYTSGPTGSCSGDIMCSGDGTTCSGGCVSSPSSYCSGSASNSCGDFGADQTCGGRAGGECTFDYGLGYCTGQYSATCTQIQCDGAASGCSNVTSYSCIPAATTCQDYTSSASCSAVSGCSWN